MDWEAISQRTLRWVQPKIFRRAYELRAGEQPVGSLEFTKAFSPLATAKLAEWTWSFERDGLWSRQTRVRQAGSKDDLAVFQQKLGGGGVLTLADGGSVIWKRQNFWGTAWAFLTPSEQLVVGFKGEGVMKMEAGVTLRSGYRDRPEIPLLVALGCYLLVLHRRKRQRHAAGA